MNFSKKINLKLTGIILSAIIILITINVTLISYSSNIAAEFTGESYKSQIINNIDSYSDILRNTIKKVARDNIIIEVLQEDANISQSELKNHYDLLKYRVDFFKDILKPISFISNINILNFKGKYLISEGEIYTDFNVENRPWFKKEYYKNHIETIITDIHEDFASGKYTISAIHFIYNDHNELLGAVSLDIFAEDLLRYIDNSFYLGNLTSYFYMGKSRYLSKEGLKSNTITSQNNSVVYTATVLDENIDIILEFNKDELLYNKEMKKINISITIILIVTGLVLAIVLVKLLKAVFKPIMASIINLKGLLNNLEKDNLILQTKDDFHHLELISRSLGKTVDDKIESLIYNDELTALPNRKMLLKLSSSLIYSNKSFALIFIDLNNFKYVNDVFGHSAGDELLKNFSIKLKDIINNRGTVTRYSGDEFVIVYDSYTNDEELISFFNTVIDEFTTPISFNNNSIIVKYSAGAAIYPRDGLKFDELIKKSDLMMYVSKKSNVHNELIMFNESIYNSLQRVDNIKFEIKNAIAKDEFIMNYQPIVNRNKSIEKVEALIRWNSNTLGFIPPVDFINYAEETGDIITIGYWIINQVCIDFKDIFNKTNIQVSINVSPIQLMDYSFVDSVKKIINKYNTAYSNFCFEITESVVLDDNITVYDNIHELSKLGIKIALDDFGTGYSSFNYLRKYKLDILKIDKSFINNASENSYKIIGSIKNIANILDMKVVIEGIETEEQFNKLSKIGCKYFQGYYFSKPVLLEELKGMLEK